tara:strand:+ start:226 stop:555 length:330 start_codon:yes stop_codon:yes gene_type:complete
MADRGRKAVTMARQVLQLGRREIHFHHTDVGIVHKRGKDVIKDPWFNKGTAFTRAEKDRLGLRGLLPPAILSIEKQAERFLHNIRQPYMSQVRAHVRIYTFAIKAPDIC